MGQELAGGMQRHEGIDITTNREQHNNYQDSIAKDTIDDISFIMDTYHDSSLATTNSHNTKTSNPSVFNLNANNNEFKGLDKELGDNSIYMHSGKVVATDGINDGQVIELSTEEYLKFRDKNDLGRFGNIKTVEKEDTSKYESVFDLNNKDDFEEFRDGTDMNYDGINSNTNIVMVTGMDNEEKDAFKSQEMIKKDFPNSNVGYINNETGGLFDDVLEWLPNSFTKKDVLNAHKLQELSPNTIVVTHSAGNPDLDKAQQVNALVNAKTPYKVISVASPTSKSDLEESGSKVGATIVTQINDENDPVANGLINKDANYDVDFNPIENIKNKIPPIPIIEDLIENHKFENYYNNGVNETIKKELNNE